MKVTISLLLLLALTATTVAQQKRQAPAKPQPKPAVPTPAPTFDTLVPADSYTIYGEVRGVGQLIRSNSFNEALEPILKLAGPPQQFKTMLKWLNTHADEVMTSRLLIATWPMAKDVPEALIAIEFASPEDAAKFASPLNKVLASVIPEQVAEPQNENTKAAPVSKPGYHLQQAGSLILLTPKPFTLKRLKAASSKSLTEDTNFRTARNRFNSEPIFVFINVKLIERQEEEQRKRYEAQRQEAEKKPFEPQVKQSEETPAPDAPAEEQKAALIPEQHATLQAGVFPGQAKEQPTPDHVLTAVSLIGSTFFGGESKWPDGVGLALALENDSFDLRALFVNEPGDRSDIMPFVPMLIPGPPIVPESPNVLPADTQILATLSLDLPQIYAAMSRPPPNPMVYSSSGNTQPVNEVVHESPFATLEKRLQLNLKDDVLPLLGSEIALRLPLTGLNVVPLLRGPSPVVLGQESEGAAGASPVLLISLRDKDGVRALMPKIVDSVGFKGASSFAQTERKEDTEIVSYVNLFSYAFIGNFLVLSPDAATVRHVVDSYLKHETLASDGHFRSFTRWQPRPAHAQLYISPALMEGYKTWIEQTKQISDPTRGFLTQFSAVSQPVTYSLSNEGFGPLHELHLPKNLVLMAVAGIAGGSNPPPEKRNEGMATGTMYMIAYAQEQYKKDKGAGSYGTLEQLIAAQAVSKEVIESSGYKFELIVTGDKFELFAVPAEYGKTGKMSFFIDQTRVLRGADRNGASATSSDPPLR